ncbi:hypothetical protein AGMMS49965_01170 [Bacteroidia bacterium]|nr:hypothetical protein AGMMS49965_01170 [Bacteroidia bacterium]
MKKIYFFIASLFVFSCSNDETANKTDEKLTGELTARVTRTLISEIPREELIAFTGDDIKSFNIKTGEIVFTGLTVEDVRARVSNSTKLTFYFDGKPLFESTSIETGVSSYMYNNLIFTWFEDNFYLADGYPLALDGDAHLPNNARQERDENAQKRAAEWDKFVKFLRDAGKTVE